MQQSLLHFFRIMGIFLHNGNYCTMIRLHKNVALSDSGYVFDPTTGESYTLNPIGLEIVQMLRQNMTDDEIQGRILDRYQVDASSLERYYMDFIGSLVQFELADNE